MKVKRHLPKLRPWEDTEASAEEEGVKSISEIADMIGKACEDPNNREKASDLCSKLRDSETLKERL